MPTTLPAADLADLLDGIDVDWSDLAGTGIDILIILGVAWAALRLVGIITHRLERHVADEDTSTVSAREQRARTLARLLHSVGAVAITIAAGLSILNLFIAIGPLLAGVGVAGLAISFGAQSLVKDIISGFFILLENQFGLGDIVEINGVGGVVEKMTMRVAMLRDVQGTLHVIPNGSITMVSNRTRGWSRAVIDASVAYKEKVDDVMRVMREEGTALWHDADWKRRLVAEPAVWGVESLGDNAVLIRIVADTRPGKQWDVARELRRRLKNRFDAEGIEIPFPQVTLHSAPGDAMWQALAARKDA